MANLKAIIQKQLGTTLTAAYTNSSGADAALKAYNVNQVGDATQINQTTGGSDWSFFGEPTYIMSNATAGSYMSSVITVSPDVLLVITPTAYRTQYASTYSDFQLVRWTGTKYECGPITRLAISTTAKVDNNTRLQIQGFALTSTKICFISLADGKLYTINIVGNAISPTFYQLDTSSILTNGISSIAPVVDNPNKVVVLGSVSTAQKIQAYNVTASANPTAAGSIFTTNITLSASSPQGSMALHRRTDNTYMVAGFNSSTTIQATIVTFTEATNTWTIVTAATAVLTNASGTGSVNVSQGLQVVPLGIDGSANYASAIVTFVGTPNYGFVAGYQTSGTVLHTTVSSTLVGSTYTNTDYLSGYHQCGSQKAILFGSNTIVGLANTAGSIAFTNLQTDRENISGAPTLILPFDTRPVYYYQPLASSISTLFGRTGVTTSGWGTISSTGNYVPFGRPSGKHYMWSDTAGCWFIGAACKIYAVDSTGVVLNELAIGAVQAAGSQYSIKNLSVSPLNEVVVVMDWKGAASVGNGGLDAGVPSTAATLYYASGVTTAAALSTATTAGFNLGSGVLINIAGDLVTYTDPTLGTTFVVLIGADYNGGTANIKSFRNALATLTTTPTAVNFGAPTSGGSSILGYPLPMFLHMSVRPTSSNVGAIQAVMYDRQSGGQFSGLDYTTTAASMATLSGINTVTRLDTTANENKATYCVSRTQSGYSVVAAFQVATPTIGRTWISNGTTAITNAASVTVPSGCFSPIVSANQYSAAIAWNLGDGASIPVTPFVQYYTTTSTPNTTLTSTSGYGWINLTKTGQYTWSAYAPSIDSVASAYGNQATNFTMTINNGTSDFYVTPSTGTTMAVGSSNRGTDVYYVPNGYSVKTKASIPHQLDTMLEILEQ